MDVKSLVASILATLESADLMTIYALSIVYREETKQKIEISPFHISEVLRQLVEEGYAIEYEETTLDLSKKTKKYIATDKVFTIAKPLPDKVLQIAKLRYITPVFYVLVNYPFSVKALTTSVS